MNSHELFGRFKKIRANPKLMKKLKIFTVVAMLGILITGALTVWAGVAAFQYVTSVTTGVIQSPAARTQFERLTADMKQLPQLETKNCWDKVVSLMAIQPWVEKRALDNFVNLKVACLGHATEGKTI